METVKSGLEAEGTFDDGRQALFRRTIWRQMSKREETLFFKSKGSGAVRWGSPDPAMCAFSLSQFLARKLSTIVDRLRSADAER